MADGDTYLMDTDGETLLHTDGATAIHENCCCGGVPGSCGSFPPLLNNYTVSWTGTATTAQCPACIFNFESSPRVVNDADEDCNWGGVDSEISLSLIVGVKWEIEMECVSAGGLFTVVWRGEKTDGDTPVGNYTETYSCGTVTIANVAVA